MALPVNGARGEVALTVAGVELVIAATMGGLARVSTRLECKSINDLFQRLSAVEPAAVLAGIDLLTVAGDKALALEKIKLRDFVACADAFTLALADHFKGDEGNGETARDQPKT